MQSELLRRSQVYLAGEVLLSVSSVLELQALIREHNRLYYQESSPVLDDGEYDALFRLLAEAEERFGIFDPQSPTKRIDVMLSRQFEKGRHLSPMISLDNTYDTQEIIAFGERARRYLGRDDPLACMLELKFDGL